jgi:c-di-GMP-binding flagellar brake protein YcgR
MKRRNRKRNSKAVIRAKIPVDAEKAAGPSVTLAVADDGTHPRHEFIAPVEVEKPAEPAIALAGSDYVTDLSDEFIAAIEAEAPTSNSTAPAGEDQQTHPGDDFTAAVEQEKPASNAAAPVGADRRIHPRYEFIAAVEVVAAESGARIKTRVRDLSQQGCYVDTSDALPLGTVTDVRIAKGTELFEARARVVYSRATKGMGLMFTTIEPKQLRSLETWLAESRETSWLAANRRRSQRVLMTVPIRVSGKSGAASPFEEDTHTRAISAHGALILLSTQVHRGQRLTLSNVQTKAALECVVAHIDRRQSDLRQVGVEFALPNPMFWHVAFPPKDWTPRHPDAKSHIKARESS